MDIIVLVLFGKATRGSGPLWGVGGGGGGGGGCGGPPCRQRSAGKVPPGPPLVPRKVHLLPNMPP